MIRTFYFYMFCVILLSFSINSYTESNPDSIVENNEISACTEKQGGNDSECLASVSELAEKKIKYCLSR